MREGLLTNPRVVRMVRVLLSHPGFVSWLGCDVTCDVTRNVMGDGWRDDERRMRLQSIVTRVTAGALLPVWSSVNEAATGDGFVPGMELDDIDVMAGVPGFGRAMASVGWARAQDDGVLFPNFHEHNTLSNDRSTGAKTGAQRTKEWRDKKRGGAANAPEKQGQSVTPRDVTVTSQRDHREEKSINTPIPPSGAVTLPASPGGAAPGAAGLDDDESGEGRTGAIGMPAWLAKCEAAGQQPLPPGSEPLAYAEGIGLPMEVLQVHWAEFKAVHCREGAKRYKDWPGAVLRSLRGNWYGIWRVTPGGGVEVTSAGRQAMLAHGIGEAVPA